VFLLNSRYPLVCATRQWLPNDGSRLSRSYAGNLPSSFGIVLSSALVCSTSPPVSVSGTVYTLELFPGMRRKPGQSDKPEQHFASVTSSRPRNIHLVPIDYGFRPRLRGRLTLRGLTLRRNPWTFGDSVSHTVCRYSCQHSHFRYLQEGSPLSLRRLTERSATAHIAMHPQLRYVALAPLHFRRRISIRPVSYYAFFKGWLLLSQPPGCFGIPTSFPT
jgi:hypothetical protein